MSLFITLEGGEGCGKTSQAKALYRRLWYLAIPALITREPGGTALGDRARRWLKRDTGTSPYAELLLFCACRAQLVSEVIRPGLETGRVVISDRYADSTLAYQGYGRGLDLTLVEEANYVATQDLVPDLTFLLDIPAAEGLARKRASGTDRFEQEALEFHEKVRSGYLKMAADDPARWTVIDGRQPRAVVRALVWHRVVRLFSRQGQV